MGISFEQAQAGWKTFWGGVKWAVKYGPVLKPIITQIVIEIEHQFPQSGIGEQKLREAFERIAARIQTINSIREPLDAIWPFIRPFIETIVAQFNKKGWPK